MTLTEMVVAIIVYIVFIGTLTAPIWIAIWNVIKIFNVWRHTKW